MEKRNSQLEHGHPMDQTIKRLVLHVRLRCGSLSITTPVSLLANAFDVRSVLHGPVSLAAVNQIRIIHEAMNGCRKQYCLCFSYISNNACEVYLQLLIHHYYKDGHPMTTT